MWLFKKKRFILNSFTKSNTTYYTNDYSNFNGNLNANGHKALTKLILQQQN